MARSLGFLYVIDEKNMEWGVEVFYRGICKKRGRTSGVFVVSLWCYAWLAWYLNSHIFDAKKYATVSTFILNGSSLFSTSVCKSCSLYQITARLSYLPVAPAREPTEWAVGSDCNGLIAYAISE